MASPLSLPQQLHFVFDSALDVNVRESFRAFGDKVLAGVQWTSWQRDQLIWDFRRGQWRGGPGLGFMRSCPFYLRLDDSTEESDGADPLARVAAGTLTARCELSYQSDGNPITHVEFRLYSCLDETAVTLLVPMTSANGVVASFPAVAEGAYLLWARAYDNLTKDDPALNAGEWSALKVVVGGGAFSVAPGVSPNPGCALYVKDGAAPPLPIDAASESAARVTFDPLARSVSASCLTETDIELGSGTVDVAAGSQIMGGLRASRSGPQSALWLLHPNLTARLLAVTEVFSTGRCECGKSDHHASDVAQAPDGTLYLLSECSLHRYAPDNTTLRERLPGSPAGNGGHPGGQTLRFLSGRVNFFTEAFENRPADLGDFFYARLITRLGGRDIVGAGPHWHGPCEAEVYHGALWGFRGSGNTATEAGRIFFDHLQGTAWSGGGVQTEALESFWRQLRRRGSLLFWFGFRPGGGDDPELDTPICAVADGKSIRRAALDFFAKRITRCNDAGDGETLLIVGNDTETGRELRNGGRALAVLELPSPTTGDGGGGGGNKVCAFWNEESAEFRLTQSAFGAAGGDIDKLPPYFRWLPRSGTNGGGVWQASATAPLEPYLQLSVAGGTLIRYALHGAPPYDLSVWGLLCFLIGPDGGIDGEGGGPFIETGCTNAQCAWENLPDGTKWRVIEREVPWLAHPLSGFQLTDLGADKSLTAERDTYPTLWARFDSSADRADLATYTHLVGYGRALGVPREVKAKVEVVLLVSPEAQPCVLPALSRRFS